MDETTRQALLLAAEGRSVDDIASLLEVDAVAVRSLLEEGVRDARAESGQMLVRAQAFSAEREQGRFRSSDFTRPLLSHLKEGLRAEGFRRKGATFVRETEQELLQAINVQTGLHYPNGPSLTYGQFAINLLIDLREVYDIDGFGDSDRARPFAPGLGSVVHQRLGHLVAGYDRWWPMEGDPTEVGDAVLQDITERGLPVLSPLRTRQQIVAALEQNDGRRWARPAPIILAAILVGQGKPTDARDVLLSYLERQDLHPSHRVWTEDLARRVMSK